MPSPHARELLDELRAGVGGRIERSGRAREVHEEAMAAYPAPQSAALDRTTAGGVEALRVTAAGAAERVGVLYLHGGGFAVGSARSDQDLLARLGHAAGAAALAIDYGLLPENPFPGPLEDTLAAYRELAAEGPLVLAGSSAGAGLAVAVALRMREEDGPAPAGLLCMSPWVDMTVSAPSLNEADDGDWLGRDSLVLAAETYLAGLDPTDPLASPLHADLTGLPPMLIQVGGSELLLDDARRLADAARRAGGDVRLDVWPGMFHNFQLFASRLDEGAAALERAGGWVRERLDQAQPGRGDGGEPLDRSGEPG